LNTLALRIGGAGKEKTAQLSMRGLRVAMGEK
jgi:hypothetical protein